MVRWPLTSLPTLTSRRDLHQALASTNTEHLVVYITSDQRQIAFTRDRRRQDRKMELRTLPYEAGSPARTTLERLALLAFSLQELEQLPNATPLPTKVIEKLDEAFNVQAVTDQFFNDYQKVFHELQDRLRKTSNNPVWAHDYALQLLNRLLFLYFIQRKRWLGNNPNFLAQFWHAYNTSGQPKNTFFDRWLSVLFFEAFNNKFHGGHRLFPKEIFDALMAAPYLNGGLFAQNNLDNAHDPKLPDDFFATLFDSFDGSSPGFLERYNFTIAESTPLDIEVAVDPEMIGKVYESLVNIAFEGLTEDDQRGSAGIFYTPRIEIDLMCRLSLTDTLANRLGQDKKALLYDAVFAYDPADKEAADRALAAHDLWPKLSGLLRETTVCDPACGSGSFLVGMLLVLDDLQARANAQLGLEETPYERRRRIIGEQLYGVDVMDWAVHVAELRLWLQLVVETDLKPAELRFRPLLPNLSFKVRCGDSLVQEIGGINLGLHRAHLDIPAPLKGRLTQLKGKKLRFYQGEAGLRETDLKKEELDVFRDILTHKRLALQKSITALTRHIESPPEQIELAGIAPGRAKQERLRLEDQWRAERAERQAELERINQALHALRTSQQVPFVWDIAFVEIFEGDKAGFDIVIGNPPYVRQEMIAPPALDPADFGGETADRWKEQKKAYKAKLQESVAAAFPKFFRYKPGSTDFRKLDGKSDLYIYFYLHGLALLAERGSFCFITSNSWLDVGYGADLQEFLLKHSRVKFILDNERKRSFAQADVNTIIALLAPPDDRRETGLDQTARFVMFKVPFEDVLDADTFKTLEAATERQSTDRWRICARPQRDLFEEGLAREGDDDEPAPAGKKPRGPFIKTARYEANKWGGKYLRAPEIFFTILEKGKGKLVRLGDIAEVRRGFTTGANEFFYLDDETIRQWGIEPEFLKPVIKSPRECRSIVIKPEDLKLKIFMCHKEKADLKGTNALEYIKWGESQGFHLRPSCRGRQRWWEAGLEIGNGVFVKEANDSSAVFFNPVRLPVDCRLYVAQLSVEQLAYLNSAIACLLFEIFNRAGLGEGARSLMVSDYNKVPCLFTEGELPGFRKTFNSICHKQPRKLLDPVDRDWWERLGRS
ncbi:Eco57I restriction-modification methylase domain-containing protein [Fontisphaera persica]|uniref:Eco57I restriction-modification methylase domain-containing protein n=1 Tax=Fontisphaera persica TaxID=2974023 RepID=UPI0024C04346|nr:DNA methyltransferase [Fontisphaera persica]WCJ60624.1 Eco57I restriction-modification methylase domain-containing protein [Fontisphaera persica]